jgi:hypothetical protein
MGVLHVTSLNKRLLRSLLWIHADSFNTWKMNQAHFVLNTLGVRHDLPDRGVPSLLSHDLGPSLDSVRAPTLVVWGPYDPVNSIRSAYALASRIDVARVQEIGRAGHVPMKETPVEFASVALGWLAGTDEPEGQTEATGEPDRDGECHGERRRTFEGAYREIRIEDCVDVLLRNVRARRIVIERSHVVGLGVVVDGDEVAVSAVESELWIAGGHLSGDLAIEASGSDLDLAGVTLVGRRASIGVRERSKLICSVCRFETPGGTKRLHESRELPGSSTL